ncbi:MAG: flippase-like domain-containing protein, partial [Solirubrobacterales bacterium]|nr:flippase-like domain-containing protein [Solirubrobacterales bacterium]
MTLPIRPGSILPDRRGLGLRLLGVAAVLGLLAIALASLPGLDEVRRRLADAAPGWLVVALALELASCLAFVVVYRGVFSRDLGWRLSYDVGMAVQGTNVLVPAGGASGLALGAWALRRRTAMSAESLGRRTVAFFLVTSSVNFLTAILAGGALALGLLGGDVPLWLAAGPAALAALTIAG